MAKPTLTVTTSTETINAERAAELLQTNTHNRPKSKAFARRYADRMLSGEWDFRLPFIVYIDTDGKMHNGQHTCTAIILAEADRAENKKFYAELGIKGPIGADAVIIDGINPESANYIDIGKKRTQGDVAFRQHYFDEMGIPKGNGTDTRHPSAAEQKKMGQILATAAKFIWFRLWHGIKPRSSKAFGVEDLMSVIEECPGLIESVKKVFLENLASEKTLQSFGNLAYFAATHYLISYSEFDEETFEPLKLDDADLLVDHIANGGAVEKGEAVYELRQWLTANIGTPRSNEDLNQLFEAILFAYKCRREGTNIKRSDIKKHCKPDAWCLLGGVDALPEDEVIAEEGDDDEENGELPEGAEDTGVTE